VREAAVNKSKTKWLWLALVVGACASGVERELSI